jgi:hypothetical protein
VRRVRDGGAASEIRTGPRVTLASAAVARVRLIARRRACGHRVEAERAELARQHRHDWREPLVCSKCGGWEVDLVVSGTERR